MTFLCSQFICYSRLWVLSTAAAIGSRAKKKRSCIQWVEKKRFSLANFVHTIQSRSISSLPSLYVVFSSYFLFSCKLFEGTRARLSGGWCGECCVLFHKYFHSHQVEKLSESCAAVAAFFSFPRFFFTHEMKRYYWRSSSMMMHHMKPVFFT